MKKRYSLLTLLLSTLSFQLFSQELQSGTWVTNGGVQTTVQSGDIIYIGGGFTQVGPNVPNGTSLSTTSGLPDLSFAKPNGQVFANAPDGNGGWFIGGNFTLK